VVLATYNERENLAPMLAKLKALLGQRYRLEIIVVDDDSPDGSADLVRSLARQDPRIHLIRRVGRNGLSSAIREGLLAASGEVAVVMDADGQHPPSHVGDFMEISSRFPEAMILGVPVFGEDAPPERVHGRKVGNFFAELETLWGGVRDSLFGFRLYPIERSLEVMGQTSHGRRFDFDTELAVRLFWAGVQPINRPVPVFYPPRQEGGVSHFAYLRDNFLLAKTHTRLSLMMLLQIRRVWKLRQKWKTQNELL
jgi:glycosyltransferase involved in cell wall biosynthesis